MNTFKLLGTLATALVIAGCGQPAENKAAGNTAAPAAPAPAPAPAAGANATESAPPTATPTGDQTNQNFVLNNQTGFTVMTLNVSPSNENTWGPDILGSAVLANGESATVTFPRAETQCLWDLRATYEDGDTTDMRGVNLCQTTTVNLTPS